MTAETKDSQVSIRLPTRLKGQMEAYAELSGRTKSHVAMEALSEYLAWRMPQTEDLKEAIRAADRSEFATAAEVAATFARYSAKPAKASPPRPANSVTAAKRKRA